MLNPVEPKKDFVKMETDLLSSWNKDGIVDKYLHKNDESSETFSFIDGPITANNPMGIHHAWGRTYKDLWQRFNNMKGKKQRFQNGFDNQGLWVEVEVEKDKGFKSKKDIEAYGVDKFVEDCKAWTTKWSDVQTEQSKRLGYFMDWDNSYYTMSPENNYMIWTFLYKCHKKGWLYKGSDAIPWCPRCGTAISQHEILTGDYADLEDDTIFFKLPIKGREKEYLLVWTTTPWTLPANVAVAVNPQIEYIKVQNNGDIYYLAKATESLLTGEYEILEELKGEKLLGLEYDYPFKNWPSVKEQTPEYKTVAWEDVGEDEGTGMVHLAPGCGQEDHHLGKEEGLSQISPIDDGGIYTEGYDFLTGKYAHDVASEIFEFMEKEGYLYKTEKYTHRYPLCWRCKTKLLFRLVDEWYISMDELRYKMMDVTKKINWMPGFGLDRELDWLKNMSDWLVSKKRYWGLALPIWECECGHYEVIKDENMLKELAVEGYEEFEGHTPHKPFIDKVKIKCPKCGKLATRVGDVGNPWLDAGIVPFSTLKYREDKDYWNKWFPADFVTECFPGQFKNWFYSLIAMSTVLEDTNAFDNLLGYSLVKDENGDEMHKSSGNAIWFDDGVQKIGADVMRWTFMRQNPENDLWFGYNLTDDVRKNFYFILWNSYKYLVTYANIHKWKPSGDSIYDLDLTTLDKWILSRFNSVAQSVDKNLEKYNASTAALELESLVNDVSTWYIRRSRDRFAQGDNTVMEVLYFVIKQLSKILMPFTPFIAEEIYMNLRFEDEPESVNLTDYPKYLEDKIDSKLETQMLLVRRLSSLGQAARIESQMKLRQPLAEIKIVGVKDFDNYLKDILKEELNVKDVSIEEDISGKGDWKIVKDKDITLGLNVELTAELAEEGIYREIVRKLQQARKDNGLKMGEPVSIILSSSSEAIRTVAESRIDILKRDVSATQIQIVSDVKENPENSAIVVSID